MDPELQRAKSIFERAIELDIEARGGYVEGVCADDAALKERVERLLGEHDKQGDFLASRGADQATGRSRSLPPVVSHYRVIEKLGAGAMGEVWKAEDLDLKRIVALKFISREMLGDAEVKARMIREAQSAASLDHPNITTVHGIHEDHGETFLAMAYIDGPSLAEKIKERPLPLEEALEIATQIAEGLQEAHEQSVVHRDIKPSNVMLDRRGRVKIMDFGLAAVADRTRLTKSGMTLGTPAYMSPEQAQGQVVDARTDIWALGVILYELLTAQHPFPGEYEQAVVYSIINEDPEPVTAQRSGLPVELDRLLTKALAKNPGERYQHAEDLAVDLKQLKASSAKSVATKRPSAVKGARWGVQIAAGLALVAFGAALSWLLFVRTSEQPSRLENMRLRRITSDNGLAIHPAISPNGEFVVYSSDRAGEGHLDLWLQQVGAGAPIRLTNDPDDELEPAFSPDGRQIAFRSNKDLGGIYVMPALGGAPSFLAAAGRRPRFSPDGKLIVYWTGEDNNVINNAIHVVTTTGGAQLELFSGKYPVWSPDGSRILFVGDREEMAQVRRNWFIGDPSTGNVVSVDALALLLEEGLGGEPVDQDDPFQPSSWAENGEVLFSAQLGDSWNIWALGLTRNGSIEGRPRRVTTGGGYDRFAFSAPSGRVVFTSGAGNQDIWSLPVDASSAKMTGPPRRLTAASTDEFRPHVTADGKTLVFTTDRAGQSDLWVMDLRDGKATPFAVSPASESAGFTNEDGSVVFYTHRDPIAAELVQTIYAAPRGGGQRREICSDCGGSGELSPDGKTIVSYQLKGTQGFFLLFTDVGSGDVREVSIRRQAYDPRYSPDGRWLAFHSRVQLENRRVFVAQPPVGADGFPSDPKPITDGSSNDFRAAWSPDGRLVYYASERDGYRCIYAQPVSEKTKDPIGAPRAVFHSHDSRLSLGGVLNVGAIGLSVARDKIVVTMREDRGDIWLLDPGD